MLITLPVATRNRFKVMASFVEANFLYHQASEGGNILEIGTGPGGSSLLMAQAMEDFEIDGSIYTIGWEENQVDKDNVAAYINSFVGINRRVVHLPEKSEDVHYRFPAGFFDFIYVDGDHSYEGVARDIRNYAPKLAREGIMAFHDTNKPEVALAIAAYLPWRLTVSIDRIRGYDQNL